MLLEGASAHRYGIEIDAHRATLAKGLGISTVQANALDVRCPAESISLLYLNPPFTTLRPAPAAINGWSGYFWNTLVAG
jgi:hypothetical protein